MPKSETKDIMHSFSLSFLITSIFVLLFFRLHFEVYKAGLFFLLVFGFLYSTFLIALLNYSKKLITQPKRRFFIKINLIIVIASILINIISIFILEGIARLTNNFWDSLSCRGPGCVFLYGLTSFLPFLTLITNCIVYSNFIYDKNMKTMFRNTFISILKERAIDMTRFTKKRIIIGTIIWVIIIYKFITWLEYTSVSPLELFYRKIGEVLVWPISKIVSFFGCGSGEACTFFYLPMFWVILIIWGLIISWVSSITIEFIKKKFLNKLTLWKKDMFYIFSIFLGALIFCISYIYIEYDHDIKTATISIIFSVLLYSSFLFLIWLYNIKFARSNLVKTLLEKNKYWLNGLIIGSFSCFLVGVYSLIISTIYGSQFASSHAGEYFHKYNFLFLLLETLILTILGGISGSVLGLLYKKYPRLSKIMVYILIIVIAVLIPLIIHDALDLAGSELLDNPFTFIL